MQRVFLLLFILIPVLAHSQWDCRSILGAHLHPLFSKKSPVAGGIEFTGSQGWMNDRRINNVMLFTGLNVQLSARHQFYFEGGFKGWNYVVMNENVLAGKPENFRKNRMGIREGFYRYTGLNSSLTVGFQSITASDLWLVSERGLGVKYSQSFGKTGFDFSGATVVKDFSRMGSYCTVKYIYNLIKDRPDAFIGDAPGETNFSGFVWWFDPNGVKIAKAVESGGGDDEFKPVDVSEDEFKPMTPAEDEFKPVDDISGDEFREMEPEKKKAAWFAPGRHGVVLYSEYGSRINTRFFYGYMMNATLFGKMGFKTQVIHQTDPGNQLLIAMAGVDYRYTWPGSHLTGVGLNTYYSFAGSPGSRVAASFTNFFIGEVLRMESQDIPLSQFYARHVFPGKKKVHLKLQHVMQYKGNRMAESDLEAGLKAFGHFRLTGIVSRITATSLNEPYYLFRLELRAAL